MKRKLLKAFFVLVILASGGYFVYDYIEGQKALEIFNETPSSIEVKEEEKKEFKLENGIELKLSPDIDLAAERKKLKNNDLIGRLEAPGLFNILIVKGKDNKFYLEHDTTKKTDFRGTEFMDYRNSINDQRINIYGHNSRDKKIKVPFQKIDSFINKKYFEENPYIVFQTDQGREYYKVMAIKNVVKDAEHISIDFEGTALVNHIDRLLKNTKQIRNVPYDENSKVMVLQTCSYDPDNSYDLVIAKKIELNEGSN